MARWVLIPSLGRLVMALAALMALPIGYLWYALYVERMAALPPVKTVLELNVSIPASGDPDDAVFIGRQDLGQTPGSDSADIRHLALLGPPDAPKLVHVSPRLLTQFNYERARLKNVEYLLADGDSFKLARQEYSVAISQGGAELQVSLPGGGTQILPAIYGAQEIGLKNWPSHSLSIGGRVAHNPSVLDQPSAVEYMKRLVNYYAFSRPAGPVFIKQTGAAENAATITYKKRNVGRDRFILSVPRNGLLEICPAVADGCVQLGRQLWSMTGEQGSFGALKSVIIGRSTYDVTYSQSTGTVQFVPVARQHWLDEDAVAEVPSNAILSPLFSRGLSSDVADAHENDSNAALSHVFAGLGGLGAQLLDQSVILSIFALLFAGCVSVTRKSECIWVVGSVVAFVLWSLAALPALIGTVPGVLGLTNLMAWVAIVLVMLRPITFAVRAAFSYGFSDFSQHFGREAITWLKQPSGIFQIMAVLTAATALFSSIQPAEQSPLDRNEMLFVANVAVILLFVVVLVFLVVSNTTRAVGSKFSYLFWNSSMIVVALGSLSLAHLTLGNRFALHLVLYERHLLALATSGLLVSFLALADPTTLTEGVKYLLRRSYLGFVVRRRRFFRFAILAVLGVLVIIAYALWNELQIIYEQFGSVDFEGNVGWIAISLILILGAVAVVFWYREMINEWLGRNSRIPSLFLAVPSVLLGLLVFVTPETGIGGVQPSELAKTWLAVLLAMVLAASLERREWLLSFEKGRSVLIVFSFFVFVAGFFALGSLVNFDLSPILIIGLMTLFSGFVIFVFYATVYLPLLVQAVLFLICLMFIPFVSLETVTVLPAIAVIGLAALLLGNLMKKRTELPTITQFQMPWYRGEFTARRNILTEALAWCRNRIMLKIGVIAVLCLGGVTVAQAPIFKVSDANKDNLVRSIGMDVVGVSLAVPVERFLSFMDASIYQSPDETGRLIVVHPDLSLQVRRSREVIAASGCGLGDEVLDLPGVNALARFGLDIGKVSSQASNQPQYTLLDCPDDALFPFKGQVPASVLRVPAIQDDFAVTFLVGSMGTDAAVLLMLAQSLMLGSMFAIALTAGLRLSQSSTLRGVGVFGAVAVANLATILFAQYGLSWLNMLGLFAVVGQPMTFISLGASHHLAFALPTLVITIAVAQMSNPNVLQSSDNLPRNRLLNRRKWGPIQTR